MDAALSITPKKRKCPIMDWKASEEQSDERVGGVGTRHIYKETLLFVGPPCFDIYLNSSRKVDFLGVSNDSLGQKEKKSEVRERCREPADSNSQKHWHNERCQQTENTENCISDRLQCLSPPYHLWRREIIRRKEEPLMHTNKVSSRRVPFKLINKQSKIISGNVLNLKRRWQQSEFKRR